MNNTVRCHGRPCCRFRRTDLHRVSSVEIRTHEAVRRVEHDVSVGARDGWIHALERQQFLLRRLDIYARKTVSPVSSIGRVQEPARIEPCQPSLPGGGTGSRATSLARSPSLSRTQIPRAVPVAPTRDCCDQP